MTIERPREFIIARPFRPFIVHTADGRRLEVRSPEFVSYSPSGRTMALHTPDDHLHVLDLLLVSGFEFLPSNGAGPTVNGH